ncbi:APC family permease [Clostridium acetireducens]|nr:APC family permease [Clostridium acetireducens]
MALAFGAMIGWAWVVLTGEWINKAGSLGSIIGFLIGGIMVLFVSLTYAELTSAMPKCGGDHVFAYRALGRNASFICTWAIILGYISVVCFEAVAFPTVIEYLFSSSYLKGYLYTVSGYDVYLTWVIVGSISSIIVMIVNYIGVKPLAFMQKVVTIIIALAGISLFTGSILNGETSNLKPLIMNGKQGILSVAVATPFLYVGFDVIPQVAEEINIPSKKIGKLLIASVIMAIIWYIMIIYSTSTALNFNEIMTSDMVTADAMSKLFSSKLAGKIIILAGIGGILTSWNSFFVGGSRAIYSMAESNMLPSFLAKLHPKYKTPTNAILLIGILSTLAPLLGKNMLIWLSNSGSFTIVISYFIVSASFLALRKKEPFMKRPYKVKFGKFVGVMAMIITGGMLILYMPGMPAALSLKYEWSIILTWFAIGAILFIKENYKYNSKLRDSDSVLFHNSRGKYKENCV